MQKFKFQNDESTFPVVRSYFPGRQCRFHSNIFETYFLEHCICNSGMYWFIFNSGNKTDIDNIDLFECYIK